MTRNDGGVLSFFRINCSDNLLKRRKYSAYILNGGGSDNKRRITAQRRPVSDRLGRLFVVCASTGHGQVLKRTLMVAGKPPIQG